MMTSAPVIFYLGAYLFGTKQSSESSGKINISHFFSWTDGKAWGPSAVSGSFLLYRETVGNNFLHAVHKPDGLTKKAFRIFQKGKTRHLVSYYTHSDVNNNLLKSPLEFTYLKDIHLSSDVYPDYVVENSRGPQSSSNMRGGGQNPGYRPQKQQLPQPNQHYHDEKTSSYYYQQQEQQRRFSAPLDSTRYDSPGKLALSQKPPYQIYEKSEGDLDSLELLYNSSSTAASPANSYQNYSEEERSHESPVLIGLKKNQDLSDFISVKCLHPGRKERE
jgi:hypothetical protein